MNADSNMGQDGLRATEDTDKPAEENVGPATVTAADDEAMSTEAAEAGDDPADAEAEAARVDETLKQGADMGKPHDAPTGGTFEDAPKEDVDAETAKAADEDGYEVTDSSRDALADAEVSDEQAAAVQEAIDQTADEEDMIGGEDFDEVELLVSTIRQLAVGTMSRAYAQEFLDENYPTDE